MSPRIKNLCFEGGGARGLAYAGALERLPVFVEMSHVERFAGTSAGAIAAFLCAIGCSPSHMKLLMDEFSRDIVCPRENLLRRIKNLRGGYGWYATRRLRAWLMDVLTDQLPEVISAPSAQQLGRLQQLTGRALHVTAFNPRVGKVQVFSPKGTPTYNALDAVIHSMSIPGYFSVPLLDRRRYTDAGLLMNYPVTLFDSWENGERVANRQTLGIRLDTRTEIETLQDWQQEEEDAGGRPIGLTTGDISFKGYLIAHLNAAMNTANHAHLSGKDWQRTIFVDCGHVGSLDFDLNDSDKQFLYEAGQKGVERYFEKKGA